MPILVLMAVPLTVLGGVWALVLGGVGAGTYALIGVIALLGLTVNPAILLVDRMQQRLMRTGCSGGSAAIGAVRERTRPVLMTSCTTIAGLWPLALSTGDEFEIWPPFATVVIGGLATSTLLTLLVIPIGYVMLARIDRIFGRLGPWILLGWIGATATVITPLVFSGQLVSLTWQIVTTVLVGAAQPVPPGSEAHVQSGRAGDRSALPEQGLRAAGSGPTGLAPRSRRRAGIPPDQRAARRARADFWPAAGRRGLSRR
jgi:hypothetical protein